MSRALRARARWNLGATLGLVLAGVTPASAQPAPTELEVKAAFLYHFTRFVEWPSAGEPHGEFVVAVLGADGFGAVVERVLAGKVSRDRPMSVRLISGPDEAAAARILFVGAPAAGRLPEVLQAVAGSGILTVGDFAGFAQQGGIIGFRTVDRRVRFDINLEQANRSGFRISSEILKLARVVRTKDGP